MGQDEYTQQGFLLFTQTVSLIPKVNVENDPARVNLRGVS